MPAVKEKGECRRRRRPAGRGRDGRRLRIGDYRAIYTIDGEQLIILILDAGPRRGIYK
ncbi:MAG: type II toxin-antitoxin system RelE/ParE family toxin [Gammaproteobacteria bacterium]